MQENKNACIYIISILECKKGKKYKEKRIVLYENKLLNI